MSKVTGSEYLGWGMEGGIGRSYPQAPVVLKTRICNLGTIQCRRFSVNYFIVHWHLAEHRRNWNWFHNACFKIQCSVGLIILKRHNFVNIHVQNLAALWRFADIYAVREMREREKERFSSLYLKICIMTRQQSPDFKTSVLWFLSALMDKDHGRDGPYPGLDALQTPFSDFFPYSMLKNSHFMRIWDTFFFDRFSLMLKTQYMYTMFETTPLQIVPVLRKRIRCDETDFML